MNLIWSHTRLILSTSRESYVRVVQLGFGLDHVSLHMINLGRLCDIKLSLKFDIKLSLMLVSLTAFVMQLRLLVSR